MCSFVGVA